MPMRDPRGVLGSCLLGLLVACSTGRNYEGPGPRYVGTPLGARATERLTTDTLRIVSFNIELALRVDSAIAALRADAALRTVDLLLVQEVDKEATQRIADAFNLWYVYYPAIFRSRSRRDFGNAVLSRWPIVDDAKILLPHRSWYGGSRRTATAATIQVGDALVRVYSTHLGTPADIRPSQRRDQMRAILADAARYSRVIIGADLNSSSDGGVTSAMGYLWPTEHGPNTTRLGRWDHNFLRGLSSPRSDASGTVMDNRGTGDHRPVWAVAIIR
jgi:endonuclease/exonuclease/phosphatase family metal-dependent hydrolase